MRATMLVYAVLVVLALVAPLAGIYPVFVMKLLCFAMFACAFNLLLGFGGILSFGHAAYFGVAGYVTGWLLTVQGWGTLEGIAGGSLAAAILGLAIGLISVRRHGIYLTMITLALGQMVYFFCVEAPFTGGENGLQGVPRGKVLGLVSLQSDLVMYYAVLALFIVVYLFIGRIVHSPYGQVLKAIRENEPRAVSLGYNVNRYKLMAFILSGLLSGTAGALKTVILGFATLSDVGQSTSGEVILMTLLGGTGTFLGPVTGAGVVVTLQEYLSDRVGAWVTVIIGVIFVICVMAFRRGIVGEIQAFYGRRRNG